MKHLSGEGVRPGIPTYHRVHLYQPRPEPGLSGIEPMKMHLFAITCGLAIVAPTVRAEPEPEAKKAIDQMVEAITKAKTLSYHIEAKGVGGYFEMLPTTKAEVIAARVENSPGTWRMRVTGQATAAAVEPTEILFVSDGTKRTWVDYPNKTVLERTATDQGPVGQAITTVAIREVFEAQPLSKERTSPNMKMETAVDIDGVKCDVVYIDPGENLTKSRYAIATTDHLPRRVEMVIQGGGIDGKRVCTLTKVKADVAPPEGSFAISTPDGFTFSSLTPNPAQTPSATPTAAKPERAVGPNLGETAPDFTLSAAEGDKVQLYSLRGQVVVVDFFGTWNLSSKRSTAEVQKLADAFKDKPVKVLGLAVREASDAAPTKFFKDNKLTYTLLLKGDEPAKFYRVKKYPTLFVLGKEGEVVHIAAGYDDKSMKDITEAINQALAGPAKAETPSDGAEPAGRIKGKPQNTGSDTGR